MSLREVAAADLAEIMADKETGFGWSLTVTDPAGSSAPIVGRSNDIGQVVDLETGAVISGRSATASLSISSLILAGFSTLPVGVADGAGLPWRVDFDDIVGTAHTFKVSKSNPDRGAGLVSLELELYSSL